jgi:signal transduction histidine kinase
MAVDISGVLHVLAHEFRTPSGIAQGYLRMLLDDRLTTAADQRRALEQALQALGRISELTRESSRLAEWCENNQERASNDVDARVFVDQVVADAAVEPAPLVAVNVAAGAASLSCLDGSALIGAVVSLLRATARELLKEPCAFRATLDAQSGLDLLIGRADQLSVLTAGPHTPDAGPLALERGGLGLSLVIATAVLDAHGALVWTVNGSRSSVGIRLPVKERAHQ